MPRAPHGHRQSLFTGLVFLLIGHAALSAALEVPPLRGRVNDTAGMLSEDRAQQLEHRLEQFEQQTGHQIAVLSVSSLQGDTLEDFSIRIAESWKIGQKGFDDGAILLISRDDRKVRIEVGYGLEGVLPDATANQIIQEVILPRFRADDYSGGIDAGITAIVEVVGGLPMHEVIPALSRNRGFNSHVVGGVLGMTLILALLTGLTHRTFTRGALSGATTGLFITLVGAPGYSVGLWIFATVFGAVLGCLGSRFAAASWGGHWTGNPKDFRDDWGAGLFRGGSGGANRGGFGGGSSSGGSFGGGGGGFGGGGASGSW
jgi:uncharacterized protein